MPPNIPTSFVPRQAVTSGYVRGTRFNFQGLFLLISFIVLGVTLLASLGVFIYGNYLDGQSTAKAAELTKREQGIDQNTVEGFLHLQSRLSASGQLLNDHVTLSSFFTLLESLTLTHIRFTTLTVTVADDRTAALEAAGEAANFNALAAESRAFSANPHIKSAIFSDFVTNKSGTIGFSLAATVDRSVIANFSNAGPTVVPTVGTTSTATTTTAAATIQPALVATSTPSTVKTTTKLPASPLPPPPPIPPSTTVGTTTP